MCNFSKSLMSLCLISILAMIPYTGTGASVVTSDASIHPAKEVAVLGTRRRQARREMRDERREERRYYDEQEYEEPSEEVPEEPTENVNEY